MFIMEYLWIILSLASAVLFGLKDILVKDFLLKSEYSSADLVYHQYLLLFFPLVIFIVFFNNLISFFDFNMYPLYIFKAFSIGFSTYMYFVMLQKYEISVVSPLINLSPLFLLVLSYIFLNELITLVQCLGILILIIATYFLEITMRHHNVKDPAKHYFSLINKKRVQFFGLVIVLLCFMSFGAIADKLILGKVNVYTNLFFTAFFIFIGLFAYYVREKKLLRSFKIFKSGFKVYWISIFTLVSNILILFAIAIPGALVSLIIPLRRTSTLFSSIMGGLLFHEKHLGKKLFAILLMLCGVILIVI